MPIRAIVVILLASSTSVMAADRFTIPVHLGLSAAEIEKLCVSDKEIACGPECKGGGSGYCYSETKEDIAPKEYPQRCFAYHRRRICKPCENDYVIPSREHDTKLNCQEFFRILSDEAKKGRHFFRLFYYEE